MIQISFICSWSIRTYSYSNTMWEKSRANLCRILCTFSIKDCIRHIKALSRILELQVNCFTQTKTLQNSGGGGGAGDFHLWWKFPWISETVSKGRIQLSDKKHQRLDHSKCLDFCKKTEVKFSLFQFYGTVASLKSKNSALKKQTNTFS